MGTRLVMVGLVWLLGEAGARRERTFLMVRMDRLVSMIFCRSAIFSLDEFEVGGLMGCGLARNSSNS